MSFFDKNKTQLAGKIDKNSYKFNKKDLKRNDLDHQKGWLENKLRDDEMQLERAYILDLEKISSILSIL